MLLEKVTVLIAQSWEDGVATWSDKLWSWFFHGESRSREKRPPSTVRVKLNGSTAGEDEGQLAERDRLAVRAPE